MTPSDRPLSIAFILAPDYALMSLSSAVEPLRAANLLAGRKLYRMEFWSLNGGFVESTAGGGFDTQPLAGITADVDIVFLVAGGDPLHYRMPPALLRTLRMLHGHKVPLGGISGGGALLARCGLMENRRFTVHWLHIEPLADVSGDLLIERALYVIDRDRYTCAGGVAAMDMMCAIIASDHGTEFAQAVSDWFIHPRLRRANAPQRLDPAGRYNLHHPALEAVVHLMGSHLADPLSAAQLATLTGYSQRQLQRLFQEHLNSTTMQFYRDLRLDKARDLLEQSTLPVIEVAISTGFSGAAHFNRCFAERFKVPPARWRRGERPPRAARPEGDRHPA